MGGWHYGIHHIGYHILFALLLLGHHRKTKTPQGLFSFAGGGEEVLWLRRGERGKAKAREAMEIQIQEEQEGKMEAISGTSGY